LHAYTILRFPRAGNL